MMGFLNHGSWPGVTLGLALLLAGAVGAAPRQRPLVGAVRWDAWTHWAGETDWAGYERCLGPKQWHYRVPFYGKLVSDTKVEVRADTQQVMDQEIAYAAAAGLDYWAFDYYHPRGWPNADKMTRALDLYLSSERANDVSYCLILLGGAHFGPKEEWPATVDDLVKRFQAPNYQKVLGGRPLVYLFDVETHLKHWGEGAAAKAPLDVLRQKSIAAGAGDPYLALMMWHPSGSVKTLEALGADAFSAYVNPPGADDKELPFSDALGLNRWFWEDARQTGKPLIPTVTAGWDYRPMKLPEFPDRNPKADWFTHAKPEELGAHLRDALDYVRQYPQTCEAEAVIIYAWNEFSEGGWICPTLTEGTARLDAIKQVLTPAPEAQTVTPEHRAAWLSDGSFGLMVHYLIAPPGDTPEAKTEAMSRIVDGFDLDAFMTQFASTGADWLIFTIGQNTSYYCSPNSVLDRLVGPGHTSRRDLILEIAQRLDKLGKRFIAYLPSEASMPQDLHAGFAWNPADQTEFQRRYTSFVGEYGERLGDKLDGWWFDGCYDWPVFPNSTYDWPLWFAAARAGNPARIAAFNDGAFCINKVKPVTALEDYHAGEVHMLVGGKIKLGHEADSPLYLPDAQFIDGVQWHALVPVDSTFEGGAPYHYSDDELVGFLRACKAAKGAVTFNLPIGHDGKMPEESVTQMRRLGEALR